MDYLPQKCMQLWVRVCVWVRIHTDDGTHAHAHSQMTNVCLCVRHCLTARAPCGDFPALALVHASFWLFVVVVVVVFGSVVLIVFSLFSVRRINCGRRVICICIAIATAIAFAFMHVDPLRLPSSTSRSPSPSPYPFSTPITLSWVKRSLCAVQPRICTFYGHVYGLQLIDYAWAEWTMPEMCKCSNAAHPLPALSAYIPPPASSLPLFQLKLHDDSARSPALPPPTASPTIAVQLQRVPTWGAHRGLLFIPTVSSPSSLVQALSSASGYVMNSICSQLAFWLWFTVGFCSRFCQRNKVLNTEIISSVTNSLHHSQLICLLWYRNTLWKSKRQGRGGGGREREWQREREEEKEQYSRLGDALKQKTETMMTETVRKYVKVFFSFNNYEWYKNITIQGKRNLVYNIILNKLQLFNH